MTRYRYRLLDEAGQDLGPLLSPRAAWPVGEWISRWQGDQLLIINVTLAEDGDPYDGYLIVRAEQPTPSEAHGPQTSA